MEDLKLKSENKISVSHISNTWELIAWLYVRNYIFGESQAQTGAWIRLLHLTGGKHTGKNTHKFRVFTKSCRNLQGLSLKWTVCICLEMYLGGLRFNINVATSCLLKLILFPKMGTKYERYFFFLNRAIVQALKRHHMVKYLRFSGLSLCPASPVERSMCCVLLYNQQWNTTGGLKM